MSDYKNLSVTMTVYQLLLETTRDHLSRYTWPSVTSAETICARDSTPWRDLLCFKKYVAQNFTELYEIVKELRALEIIFTEDGHK